LHLTQSPPEQPRNASQEISNLFDVSLRTASATPRAFYDELAADFTQRTSQLAVRVGEGVIVGVAGTLLLKAPKIAPLVMTAGLIYTGVEAAIAGDKFIGKASQADTPAQREAVARASAHALGSNLSAFVESAPGMIAGGYGISKALGAPPLYTRIGDAASDTYNFRGPGSIKALPSLVNQEGAVDALTASKIMAQRSPWQGVETGSSLDLNRMRLSRVVTGEKAGISSLPGYTRDSVVTFHTHGPEATAGFLPSNVDVRSTPGLGILRQGDITTYYAGEAKEYAALAKEGWAEHFSPSLRAVVVDNKTGLAQRFTGKWLPGTAARELDQPVTLDLGQLLEKLSRVPADNPGSTLLSIAAKTGG
jgi:hypothetical protein